MTPRSRTRSGWIVGLAVAGAIGAACTDAAPTDPTPSRPATGRLGTFGTLLSTPGGAVVAEELVIEPRPGIDEAALAALAAQVGAIEVVAAPGAGVYVLRFADLAATAAASATLASAPEVARVEPSKVATGTGIATSPIIIPYRQWNLNALRLRGLPGGDATYPVGDIVVAVLDSGAAYETYSDATGSYLASPDLADVPFAQGVDLVDGDNHPNDRHGHGTHIAATIAASSGAKGIAPGVELMVVRILNQNNVGTEAALAEGIVYAVDHGADVINMSLSFPPEYFPSPYLQRSIDYAARANVVMIGASGNNGATVVTYPAAFRDVIAVGASRLKNGYTAPPDGTWPNAPERLRRANYSNHGQRLDFVSPAGVLDADADGDGDPEGILARTFNGNPLQLDYWIHVGTSQATAEISGVAALMLAQNPELTPTQVRDILGETALRDGTQPLSTDIGMGHVRADLAIEAAAETVAGPSGSRYAAAVNTTMHALGPFRFGRAEVEVLDENGAPAPGVRVYGSFSGGFFASQRLTANSAGRAVFYSSLLEDNIRAIGFQVDAIGASGVIDRPRGAVRIDSCSLEMLATVAGSGIATSPGPINLVRPTIGNSEVPTVALLNFAWGNSTLPMSVAVDRGWFEDKFPDASELRVEAQGSGIATSPIIIDPGTGFAQALSYSYPDGNAANCLPLVLRTFGEASNDVLSPKPGACSGECKDTLNALWSYSAGGSGIATSPNPPPPSPPLNGSGLSEAQFTQLGSLADAYAPFSTLDGAVATADYAAILGVAGVGMTAGGATFECADGDISCEETGTEDGDEPADDSDSEMPSWGWEE